MFYAVEKSLSPRQVVKYVIKVAWGRKCEGHVIISNLITYFITLSSVASNQSGNKSWISALPLFTEVQMSIHSKSVLISM